MVDIHHSATAAAPAELVFDYVADYTTVPEWMFGLSQFEPIGDQVRGIGATFDAAMKLGPKTLHSTVTMTTWDEGSVIGMESIKGFVNWSTWRFVPLSGETTELSVDFTYVLPGGVAGKALGRIIEPFVSVAIKQTEQNLRSAVERLYAERGA